MELNYYWLIIKKYIYLPVILAIMFSLYGYYNYRLSPILYTGSITFTTGNSSLGTDPQFNYDHYYNLAASSNLADTVSSLLNSPNTIDLIYKKAGLTLPSVKMSDLGKIIRTTKSTQTSTVIVATVDGDSHQETELLLNAASSVITDQIKTFHKNNSIPAELNISVGQPTVVDIANNPVLTIVLDSLAGLVLGLVLVFFIRAVKPTR